MQNFSASAILKWQLAKAMCIYREILRLLCIYVQPGTGKAACGASWFENLAWQLAWSPRLAPERGPSVSDSGSEKGPETSWEGPLPPGPQSPSGAGLGRRACGQPAACHQRTSAGERVPAARVPQGASWQPGLSRPSAAPCVYHVLCSTVVASPGSPGPDKAQARETPFHCHLPRGWQGHSDSIQVAGTGCPARRNSPTGCLGTTHATTKSQLGPHLLHTDWLTLAPQTNTPIFRPLAGLASARPCQCLHYPLPCSIPRFLPLHCFLSITPKCAISHLLV